MKTKIVKIIFLVTCIGLFIFLLLPFLETTSAPGQAQLKAQPQVTTDNPLTAIAKRLRNLFGHKERANRRWVANPSQASTPRVADEFLVSALPTGQTTNRPNPPFAASEQTRTIGIPQPEEPFDFGDASLQTDQGEWFLIRQTVPQSAQPGMHEVNVHDNPYDRYIKQERAQRALPQQTQPEIPDSKWARLVRPVKHFLGLDTPTPVGASPVSVSHEGPRTQLLATAKEYKQTGTKSPTVGPAMRLPWPDITPQQWAKMTPKERERETERRSVAQFTNLLSGEQAAEQAAKIAADIKFPNPKNKQEEQAKEEYKQQVTEQNKQIIKNGILHLLQHRAEGEEPVDELSDMMGCKSTSLPDVSDFCALSEDGHSAPPPTTPQNIIEQEQTKNAEDFLQQTKYMFPKGLPLTPVLSPTTPETISNMSGPDEDTQQTAEIYQFLYKHNKCDTENCYWVANSKQHDPQLGESVTMANTILVGDPLNQYPAWGKAFEQYKIEQLGKDATEEQKKKAQEDAKKQWEQNSAHYIPYDAKLLYKTQQQKKTIFFLNDKTRGPELFSILGNGGFVTGISPFKEANSPTQTGHLITQSFGQETNDRTALISDQVTKPAVSTAVSAAVSVAVSSTETQPTQPPKPSKGIKEAFENWEKNK